VTIHGEFNETGTKTRIFAILWIIFYDFLNNISIIISIGRSYIVSGTTELIFLVGMNTDFFLVGGMNTDFFLELGMNTDF